MSEGTRLPFDQAFKLAKHLVDDLAPHVQRLKVAGSLRRRRPDVGDLEIVVEPRLYETDLFGGLAPDIDQVRFVAMQWGRLLKNGERMIQVGDVKGIVGFKAELYLVHPPAQWGSILAIRTGPAHLGQLAMTRMRSLGRRHQDGYVVELPSRRVLPTPDEQSFFRAADLPCVPPARRDALLDELLQEHRRSPS